MPLRIYNKIKGKSSQGLEKFLGELELAVMEIVWQHQPVTVRDVLAELNQRKRNLAYTTVMTIMGRLAEKGWLVAEKQGRAHLYRAAHSRQEAETVAVGEVVHALLQEFGDVAVAQFVKQLDKIDPDQLSRLAELVQATEQSDNAQK